jgi:cyclophilin family peptidyl-prolyl cis-trans isomerase
MKKFFNLFLTILIFIAMNSCATLQMPKIAKEQKVKIETTQGIVVVKLYNETPLHRDNFKKLVKENFYDGLLFHRVISDFMIQGGDPDSKNAQPKQRLGGGSNGYTLPAELIVPDLYHKKGALAAARTGDNVNPLKNSSGCQFYIVVGKTYSETELDKMAQSKNATQRGNVKYSFSPQARSDYQTIGGTPHLDGDYTVFGEVIKGLDVITRIATTPTDTNDRPTEDVKIIKMKLVR